MGDFGVRHLTAAKTYGHFKLIARLQEFYGIFKLCVKVVRINANREPDLFDFDDFLILPGFFLAFRLLKLKLAIIHNLADRGLGLRSNFYQIEVLLARNAHSLSQWQYAKLFAALAHQAHFFVSDILVDLQLLTADIKAPPL